MPTTVTIHKYGLFGTRFYLVKNKPEYSLI